jgi:hypothetical protein
MGILKNTYRVLSAVFLCAGLWTVNTFPASTQLHCVKLEIKRDKFCTYGLSILPWISRSNCSLVNADKVVCEKIDFSINPIFKKSSILADPTGSYVGQTTSFKNSKSFPTSTLTIVNYHSGKGLSTPNYILKDKGHTELLKKQLDVFLKEPTHLDYQIYEESEWPWSLALPAGLFFGSLSVLLFKESCKR